jgi:hypothetical protein
MATLQLQRSLSPEALARVMSIPYIEVADLGAGGRGEAEEGASRDEEGAAGARWDGHSVGKVQRRRGKGC